MGSGQQVHNFPECEGDECDLNQDGGGWCLCECHPPVKPQTKYLDIKEFRSLGLLREVNRQFLHPIGLALAVERDGDGNESLFGILDARDDPEGFVFWGLQDDSGSRYVDRLRDKNRKSRHKLFGQEEIVQPLGVDVTPSS